MMHLVHTIFILSLLLIAYASNLQWLWSRWMENPNYSYGPIIPLISLFIIYQNRSVLNKIKIKGSNNGLYILITAVLLFIVSIRAQVNFLMSYSMVLAIAGIILFIYGKKMLMKLIFPISYLIFMIPFYVGAINKLSNMLKMLSSIITSQVLSLISIEVFREGAVLNLASGSLEVADPCSGIRSFIALLALGTLLAYYSNLSKFKKVFLVLIVAPLAVLANSIRVLFFCLVLETKGIIITEGTLHTLTGLAVFGFALMALVGISKCIHTS